MKSSSHCSEVSRVAFRLPKEGVSKVLPPTKEVRTFPPFVESEAIARLRDATDFLSWSMSEASAVGVFPISTSTESLTAFFAEAFAFAARPFDTYMEMTAAP